MRDIWTGLVAALVLWGVADFAQAGEYARVPHTPPGDPVERLIPHEGGWWNPAEGGSGYAFQFFQMPDGSVLGFCSIYTYREDGSSTFLVLQVLPAPFQPHSLPNCLSNDSDGRRPFCHFAV